MIVEQKYFNYQINGLRGLCILLVYIYHVYNSGFFSVETSDPLLQALSYFISTFKYGVEIFFMISGYVIVNSIRSKPNLRAFFSERAVRIYPTWVPLHLLTFFITPLIGKSPVQGEFSLFMWALYFISALFLMPPVVPTPLFHPAAWSLSYEWSFYLVAGSLFFLLVRGVNAKFIVALALFAILGFANFFPRGLFFIPGILTALYEPWIRANSKYFTCSGIFVCLYLVFWGQTGANNAGVDVQMIEWGTDHRILFAGLSLLISIYMFAAIVAGKGVLAKGLLSPAMQFMGKISYSFYLWSPLCFFLVKAISRNFFVPVIGVYPALVVFAFFTLLLSLIVSWLNWYVIEQRFSSWLKPKVVASRMGK